MLAKFYSLIILFSCCMFLKSLQADQPPIKIKIIVFDFGSVIAKTDKTELSKSIAKILNISEGEALLSLEKLKEHTNQGGEEADFWPSYVQSIGKKLPNNWSEKLVEAKLQALKEIPGMIDSVKKLQKLGFQTALLSNVRASQAEIKRQLGYYDLFNPILLSYEIQVRKPDPKAFQILLERLHATPDTVLFVDNKAANTEVAKALGIDSIQFIDAEQFIKELKKRGIDLSNPENQSLNKPVHLEYHP